ncbi:short chain dehydrogenase family protein [Rutstroemia sp. NJR-2017a BBW]|nr:short chain dehydrogenase family protein [Rutstroemia sp. NJR-2017a BBW]
MSLQGKIIAITGGASGIGLATAKLLSSRGATVCIGDIDLDALSTASEYFAENNLLFLSTEVDVTKRQSVEDWMEAIIRRYRKIDGAANCAGVIGKYHGVTGIQELEDAEWDRIIGVNLTGLMYSLRAELQKIEDGGSIVNLASIQGTMGEPEIRSPVQICASLLTIKPKGFAGSAAYVASKHGVIGLTRSAAQEVGDRNIRVNAVAPGAIETPLLAKARAVVGDKVNPPAALKRIAEPEEIAAIVVFLLSQESSYVTGAVYAADGGWSS